jgi:uncharacterized protein YndB with AHSA1/START domain
MTVTDVRKDPENLTLSISSEFPVSVERTWELWADPRQLERWWGPPGYPATFVDHDLTPGARCRYYMTSPEGDSHWGWWDILAVDAPKRLELRDGFAGDDGEPAPDMPEGTMVITIEATADGSRMTVESHFPSAEVMAQLLEMGQEEGMIAAAGQIDAILAEPAAH